MKLPLYDKTGKRTQDILEFDEKIFGDEIKHVLLKEAILMFEACQRQGTHATKNRSAVAGSGRKLWRQKGTGRARVGPARAPHHRGGGKVFGPHPKDYRYSMPKKARINALNSAWLAKFQDRGILVIEDFDVQAPKTKKVVALLKTLNLEHTRTAVCVAEENQNLLRSVRNMKNVCMDLLVRFNPYVLLHNHNVLMTKKAFEALVASKGGKLQTLKRAEVYKS